MVEKGTKKVIAREFMNQGESPQKGLMEYIEKRIFYNKGP